MKTTTAADDDGYRKGACPNHLGLPDPELAAEVFDGEAPVRLASDLELAIELLRGIDARTPEGEARETIGRVLHLIAANRIPLTAPDHGAGKDGRYDFYFGVWRLREGGREEVVRCMIAALATVYAGLLDGEQGETHILVFEFLKLRKTLATLVEVLWRANQPSA